MAQNKIPTEHRSKLPTLLRELAMAEQIVNGSREQKLLLDAAAEIEGGEVAYADLVAEIRVLREKIAGFERNLL